MSRAPWTDEEFSLPESPVNPADAERNIMIDRARIDRGLSAMRENGDRLREALERLAEAKKRASVRYIQIKLAGCYPDAAAPPEVWALLPEGGEPRAVKSESELNNLADAECGVEVLKAEVEALKIPWTIAQVHVRARGEQMNGQQSILRAAEQAINGQVPGGHRRVH